MLFLVLASLFGAAFSATTMGPTGGMTTMGPTTMGPTTMGPTTMGPTTMPPTTHAPIASKVLIDFKHHKAMIVRDSGCYEYHMNHNDVVEAQTPATRPAFETRIIGVLDAADAATIHETGHHHIDHMTQAIKDACAALPVYSFQQWCVKTRCVGLPRFIISPLYLFLNN